MRCFDMGMPVKLQMIPIAYEPVTRAEAKFVHDGAPPAVSQEDWTKRRAGPDAHESLREETTAWMRELPAGVRPPHLAERFPRIANKICALWMQPLRCAAYLSDLLIARRPNRKGFPAEVAMEIGNLSIHYELLNPIGRPWQ
jgi:hypothetical protein